MNPTPSSDQDAITPPQDAPEPTSVFLQRLVDEHQHDHLSFGDLMHAMHEKGFAFLMLFMVLPNCIPIPIPPGGSTVFSVPVLFLAVQMAAGMHYPWLPAWLRKRGLSRNSVVLMVQKFMPFLRRLEKVLKVRYTFASPRTMERLVGAFSLLFGLSIAVPLPMTNFPPGVGILVMSLGLLSRDGLAVIIGMVIGTLGCIFTTLLLLLGTHAVEAMLGMTLQ